jgi:NAD(P)-dependent dehydrogenase (short-subunit alcohol dehydrogenase family)
MRTALILGSSDGIGRALAESLLADGWRVVGVSRSASPALAPQYVHHVADVCELDYGARLSQLVDGLALDLCVYCAGVGELLDLDTFAGERRVFETNLMGAVTTAMVVIPAMVRAGRGHFIGLSSQADEYRDPLAPSYAASKAGLSSYLEGLAPACRGRGVYVSNVRFGFVDTKMAKSPVKPFMVSPARAAQHLRRCMERRPVRDTFPKRMAVLMVLLRLGTHLRRWLPGRR